MEIKTRGISTVSALAVSALLFFVVASQALAGNKLFVGGLSFDTSDDAAALRVEGALHHGLATAATKAGFDLHVRVDLYDDDGNRIGFLEASTPLADILESDRTQSRASNRFSLELEWQDLELEGVADSVVWLSVRNPSGNSPGGASIGLRSDGELVQ